MNSRVTANRILFQPLGFLRFSSRLCPVFFLCICVGCLGCLCLCFCLRYVELCFILNYGFCFVVFCQNHILCHCQWQCRAPPSSSHSPLPGRLIYMLGKTLGAFFWQRFGCHFGRTRPGSDFAPLMRICLYRRQSGQGVYSTRKGVRGKLLYGSVRHLVVNFSGKSFSNNFYLMFRIIFSRN